MSDKYYTNESIDDWESIPDDETVVLDNCSFSGGRGGLLPNGTYTGAAFKRMMRTAVEDMAGPSTRNWAWSPETDIAYMEGHIADDDVAACLGEKD